jgi:hypothetical protein
MFIAAGSNVQICLHRYVNRSIDSIQICPWESGGCLPYFYFPVLFLLRYDPNMVDDIPALYRATPFF